MIAVGLMSGTSLDGVDAALVRILPRGTSYRVDLLNFHTYPFEDALLERLREALPPSRGSVELVCELHQRMGDAFGRAALSIASDMPLDFVASHGQTIFHDGDARRTLQIADAFVIRERASATVCYDFRSADCAAGGEGAPLVPYVDALLLASDDEDRVAVNIGGIANVTYISPGAAPLDVVAFDTGPGNMLIDAFVRERTGGARTFDRGGALALHGAVDDAALRAMLEDAYFTKTPPKTTGRERFGAQFLRAHEAALSDLTLEDGCATLAALTAMTIADGVRSVAPRGSRVLLSGGGAHNAALVRALVQQLDGYVVQKASDVNLHGDAKEAIAFAVLGYELLRGQPANVPRATGARRAVVLGAIAPHDLRSLLAKVDAECQK